MFDFKRFISIIVLLIVCENHRAYDSWFRPRTGTPCEWDGVQGTCENFWTCYTNAIDAISGHHPPICSIKNGEVTACCTGCELVANLSSIAELVDYGVFVEKSGKKSADKCLDYMMLYKYSCHMVTKKIEKQYLDDLKCYSYRLINCLHASSGRNALRNEYPHMALLGYGEELESAEWLCGGSIISKRYILTAAHCGYHDILGAVRYVAVGILKRSDPPEMWQIYNVASFIPHPDQAPHSNYHDIALIKTDRRILMGPSVSPACLPQGDEDVSSAHATGWGAKAYRGKPADVLQTGDSGGPLQLDSCPHVVIGVTSSGHPCGFPDSPGLYTRVGHYLEWLEDTVWP